MARFLLVHGAAHGAWCWRDTIPALQALGHVARAIDLPGHGADTTPLGQVTLDRYADAVLDALDAPAVVVGHSMGGYPISVAAERAPDRIARLVYLCAYVPWSGLSLAEMRREAPTQPLVPAIRRNDDGVSMHFDPAMAPDLFYHDCTDASVAFALANLCDQPLAPMQTPAPLGNAYASVPRSYIVCEDDRAIPPALQHRMAADFAPEDRHSMNTSHSPFLSDPTALAALLNRIAG
ncbi:alpha/beta fold hydrolase [Citreimonas sp.]|uniref:alpha/beta fold hydrolase n=1 Tax=Citreimonas sp. TaxID=3036715 RepID=UPI0035C81DC2